MNTHDEKPITAPSPPPPPPPSSSSSMVLLFKFKQKKQRLMIIIITILLMHSNYSSVASTPQKVQFNQHQEHQSQTPTPAPTPIIVDDDATSTTAPKNAAITTSENNTSKALMLSSLSNKDDNATTTNSSSQQHQYDHPLSTPLFKVDRMEEEDFLAVSSSSQAQEEDDVDNMIIQDQKEQEQKQEQDDEEEWEKVSINIPIGHRNNNNNPNHHQTTMIDIYINQHNPKRVYRDCQGEFYNEIIYSVANTAGMNDRRSCITHMSELAAFLCATLTIHSPYTMLAKQHNGGKKVSKDLKWSDFLIVKPNDMQYNDHDDDDHHHNNTTTTTTRTTSSKSSEESPSSFYTFLQERRSEDEGMTSKFRLPQQQQQFSKDVKKSNIILDIINNTIFFQSSKRSFISSFEKAFEISLLSSRPNNNNNNNNKRSYFSWMIPTNMYSIRTNFKEYLWRLQNNNTKKSKSNTTILYLPWIDYMNDTITNIWRGYDYTQKDIVPHFFLEGIKKMIPGILEQEQQRQPSNNNTNSTTTTTTKIFGTWHIRRGDSKVVCDTELETRLSKYIPCTFNENVIDKLKSTQQQIILLIQTDETGTKYLQGIQQLFDSMKPYVRVIMLDQYIANHPTWQSYWPVSYQNNYHRFEIGNHIKELLPDTAFRLVHRRQFDCKDCYVNLQDDLDHYLGLKAVAAAAAAEES